MRKNFAIAICGIFAIICVGSAIGMFYVKTEPMNIDLMAALVGVLSILVTVLRACSNFLQKVFSASSQASFRSVFLFLFAT